MFMIVARVFTLFALDDSALAAVMVNAMSGLASAFTILFLFWSITHLTKKIISPQTNPNGEGMELGQKISILGSGLVGALAYTFSDTFWFSAVEGEVYAFSSLFTALVFWAILKWENISDAPGANRWLILIAYLMGLSIGIHLLNLLAIPAIVFVYYFKKYTVSRKGILIASLVAVALLGSVMYGIIPGVIRLASLFELAFVNGFGMPYNTGVFVYALLLVSVLVIGLYWSYTRGKVLVNTILLSVTVILIGYSSFAMIVIRSGANPPMDENDPENVFALMSYLNREQYGDRPLIYGQYYSAQIVEEGQGKPVYVKRDGKYVVATVQPDYKFDPKLSTLFPRMYSSNPSHVSAYVSWGGVSGRTIVTQNRYGETETLVKPSFGENLAFFFKYQVGHMYFRYFMWNFSGRQNDNQSHGGIIDGNWITGFDFLDSIFLGPQVALPAHMLEHPARNRYFLLPLFLGIVGLMFQLSRSGKEFSVVMLLFFFTGIAIVIYLNQTPYQPRERDYAYAGSFYAFSIWIGMGVAGLWASLRERLGRDAAAASVVSVLAMAAVPGLMAAQNWDDHNRSGRYTARDFAINFLNSCAPNAILFTYGDNDTFPLWYVQEVEGIRTDVKVVNLSLLGTDWYIQQMRRQSYDAAPVPMGIPQERYTVGTLDVAYVIERVQTAVELREALDFLANPDPTTKEIPQYGQIEHMPARRFFMSVDKRKVIENGTVLPEDAERVLDTLSWAISNNYLTKSDIAVLDIIASNEWERPIYFATTQSQSSFLGLEKYLKLEGFAYRLVPVSAQADGLGFGEVSEDIMYANITNPERFKWGRIGEAGVHVDEQNLRTTRVMAFYDTFARLSLKLAGESDHERAVEVLDLLLLNFPSEKFPRGSDFLPVFQAYLEARAYDKALALGQEMVANSLDWMAFFERLSISQLAASGLDLRTQLAVLGQIANITQDGPLSDLHQQAGESFNQYNELFSMKLGAPIY